MGFNQQTYYIKLSIARQKQLEKEAGGPDAKSAHKITHYGKQGQCLCDCVRCMGKGGCICRGCSGVGHWGCRHAENKRKNPVTGLDREVPAA